MILPSESDLCVTIPFDSPHARWSLLVIDDMWDSVRELIFGIFDELTNERYGGIGEQYLSRDVIETKFNQRYPGAEIYELALWLLPWAVAGIKDYAGITFCDFPMEIEKLAKILDIAAQAGHENHSISRQVAVLCDVRDFRVTEEEQTENFIRTWDFLDTLGHPAFARAKFTQGGRATPGILARALNKHPEDSGEFKKGVQRWLSWVCGQINPFLFATLANHQSRCHHPSTLAEADVDTRKRICDSLIENDSYGVWRWCAELATRKDLPPRAQHRWLAGKAFQTTRPEISSVPVTALVAICEGARNIAPVQDWDYDVESGLCQIATNEVRVAIDKCKINKPGALGYICFSRGNYGDFAVALRDWLIHHEHFEPRHSRLQRIQILPDRSGSEAQMRLQYSNTLPQCITREGSRVGSVFLAWTLLSQFALRWDQLSNTLILTFSYKG